MTLLHKLAATAALGLMLGLSPASAQQASPADTLTLTTDKGDVVIALRPDLAPQHVARIKDLVAKGAYNDVVFHRVIDGFMAQTGDVQYGKRGASTEMAGMGGSDQPDLPAEFSKETFDRGTVGMARAQNPDSANSQFFIMLADGDFLDGQYTVVGDVTTGMDVVDQIKKGDPNQNGSVADPDYIVSAKIGG
jgi:peptidylprolyl isomerase